MNNITNLTDMIASLNDTYSNLEDKSIESFTQIMKCYNGTDWQKYVTCKDDSYSKNLIYKNDDFDVYLVCWKTNDKTPIHDHSQYGCVYKILQGQINELKYDPKSLKNISKNTLKPDTVNYIHNDESYHVMDNVFNKLAISIHIYSPPKYKMNIY
jgi:cysteine dioxygenase